MPNTQHDDWMTPSYAWEQVKQYIPADKVIWEPFFGDGQSGQHLQDLGFTVIHNDEDFFECDHGEIVVTNPTWDRQKLPQVLARLKHLGKPFMLLMRSATMCTQYFQRVFADEGVQIIVPPKRIQFLKFEGGEASGGHVSPDFDT